MKAVVAGALGMLIFGCAGGAATELEAKCEQGDLVACSDAAGRLFKAGENLEHARELAEKACGPEAPAACGNLGSLLSDASWGYSNLDPALAREFYQKGCAEDDVKSCGNLAMMLTAGDGGPKDGPRARILAERACNAREPETSAQFCVNLAVMFIKGQGGSADAAKTLEFSVAACDLDNPTGCGQAGLMLHKGLGVAPDPDRARPLLERACEGGVQPACEALK